MSQKIVVKKVKVGVPIKRVTSGAFSVNNLGGVSTEGQTGGSLLIHDAGQAKFVVGTIEGTGGTTVDYDSGNNKYEITTKSFSSIDSDIIPATDETIDLGSPTRKFKELYLSGNSLHLGNIILKDSDSKFTVKDSDNADPIAIDLAQNTTTDLAEGTNLYFTNARVRTEVEGQDLNLGSNDFITTGSIRYQNVFDSADLLPDALQYHGMFAHIHSTGVAVFSHAGAWHTLVDQSSTNSQTVKQLTSDSANITMLTVDSASFTNLSADNLTFTTDAVAEGNNLYYTTLRADSDAKRAISVLDQGGDGSLSYDTAAGQIEYNGPSASETRAHFSAGGDITYDSSTGRFSLDVEASYTQANFESDLGAAVAGGTGITYDSGNDVISITNTGVSQGTYGSASQIPVFTVNAQGQLDSAGTVAVAGVSSINFDSSNGNLTINTADGGVFTETITLDPYTTTDLTEGTNQYFTTTRARNSLQSGTGVTYDSSTGQISIGQSVATSDSAEFQGLKVTATSSLSTITANTLTLATAPTFVGGIFTGDVSFDSDVTIAGNLDVTDSASFGGNLKVVGNLIVSGTTTTVNTEEVNIADNIIVLNSNATGSATENGGIEIERGSDPNKTFIWDEGNDRWTLGTETLVAGTLIGNVTGQVSDISNHNTGALTEGSNLYYTDTRARNAIGLSDVGGDGSLAYDSATGRFTYTGPSASEVRAHFSAGGDMSYDSSTGVFSIDVEDIYSQANFDSDFLTRLETQIDSAGITTLTTTTGTITTATINSATITNLTNTNLLTGNQATFDSANITNLQLPDNGVMRFGDEGDFSITHNGSHTVLKDGGTGDLYIEGSKIHLSSQNNGNPIFVTTGDNDGVKLFDSSGDIRLYTHSTGVNVVGALTFGSLTNTTSDISEGTNLYYTTARADSDAKNAVSASGNGIAYNSTNGQFSLSGTIDSARLPVLTLDNITDNGATTTNNITVANLTTTTGVINVETTATSVSAGGETVIDTQAHDSDFMTIEYLVQATDATAAEIHSTKIIAIYDKTTSILFNEFGTVFSGDSDLGTLTADVNGDNVRLLFNRRPNNAININLTKTVIKS